MDRRPPQLPMPDPLPIQRLPGSGRSRGIGLAFVLVALNFIVALSIVAFLHYMSARKNAEATTRLAAEHLMAQDAYALVAEGEDRDSDGIFETADFTTVNPAPVGGGGMPTGSSARSTDGMIANIGYCVWDNGSVMSSSGYNLAGDNPATDNSVVFALVWPGLDRKFQTDCATAKTGQARGDDLVKVYTIGQIRQGLPAPPFQGAPVNNATTLAALTTSGLQPGHMRLQTDTATLSAWSGSNWATVTGALSNPAAGYKNILINGNFDIWQRGTGSVNITNGNASYIADHWMLGNGSGSSDDCYGYQISLLNIPTYDAPVGADYGIQIDPPSSFNGVNLIQPIEDVHTGLGQTVTLSWWARTVNGGNVSMKASFIQDLGPSGSTGNQITGTAVTLSQYWTRYWQTFTLPALPSNPTINTGQDYLGLYFSFDPMADSVQIAQVQLERGAQPTGFEHRPLAVELAMAQRYFESNHFDIGDDTADTLKQWLPSGTLVTTPWTFRVPKRIPPDGSVYNRNIITLDDINSIGFTTFTCAGNSVTSCPLNVTKAGFGVERMTNGTSGAKTQVLWWDADAEYYY